MGISLLVAHIARQLVQQSSRGNHTHGYDGELLYDEYFPNVAFINKEFRYTTIFWVKKNFDSQNIFDLVRY